MYYSGRGDRTDFELTAVSISGAGGGIININMSYPWRPGCSVDLEHQHYGWIYRITPKLRLWKRFGTRGWLIVEDNSIEMDSKPAREKCVWNACQNAALLHAGMFYPPILDKLKTTSTRRYDEQNNLICLYCGHHLDQICMLNWTMEQLTHNPTICHTM